MQLICSRKRFIFLKAPTGVGKTLIAMAYAQLQFDTRRVYLTATKGLEDQISSLHSSHVYEIRGHNNYRCFQHSEGGCDGGIFCEYRPKVSDSLTYDTVLTNYAHWIHANDILGKFDLLICDEGHRTHAVLADCMKVIIELESVERYCAFRLPPLYSSIEQWKEWADKAIDYLVDPISADYPLKVRRLEAQLNRLASLDEFNTIVKIDTFYGTVEFSIIWATKFAESNLFCSIKKVILMSATLNQGHQRLLGISDSDAEWIELDSPFPARNRRFYFVNRKPQIWVKRNTTHSGLATIIRRHDEIIQSRSNSKGLIHSRSYALTRTAQTITGMKSSIRFCFDAQDTAQAIRDFRRTQIGSALAGPALTEGYDFPEQEINYQIFLKVPYLDRSDEVTQRRIADDPDYEPYEIVSSIQQAAGRIQRLMSNRSQSFMLDAAWYHFARKYKHLFDHWFSQSWENCTEIPEEL